MTPEQTRRQEMIDYLNTLKFAHQQHALNEISRHGSDQYAQHEMDKAQMVEEIMEIVEAKVYVEETETIYVDIDKMIEKYKEEKPNILPGFIGLDQVTGQELYEVLEK